MSPYVAARLRENYFRLQMLSNGSPSALVEPTLQQVLTTTLEDLRLLYPQAKTPSRRACVQQHLATLEQQQHRLRINLASLLQVVTWDSVCEALLHVIDNTLVVCFDQPPLLPQNGAIKW
jgi:hypothetical protein